MNSSIIELER